jgi:hypothetical protein
MRSRPIIYLQGFYILRRADDKEASIYKNKKRWKRREKENIYQRRCRKPRLGLEGL